MRPSKPLLTKKPMMRLNRIGIRDRRVLVVDGGPRPQLRHRAIILSANIRAFHARIRFGLEEDLKPRKSWVSGSRNRESDWGSASANSGKLRSAEAPLRQICSQSLTSRTVEAERISVDHVAHLKPSDGGSATQLRCTASCFLQRLSSAATQFISVDLVSYNSILFSCTALSFWLNKIEQPGCRFLEFRTKFISFQGG